ncbi:MAG TPA: amidohydrolase family protein [Terracidiphilus sp.]|nr:amidohydrolase family protein [Terracidiphilus sp.]
MPRPTRAFLLLLLAVSALAAAAPLCAAGAEPNRLLIRGNIVTPDGVIANGWLDIRDGRIVHIEREKPDVPGVPALETSDLIFPGFVDLHNHPTFNIFPRWTPPHKFPNRYAWRDWDVYRARIEAPARAIQTPDNFCDIDEYIEVKGLIGGTTSMIGFSGRDPAVPQPDCIKGLLRNLDVYTGFYGADQGHERIANSVGILPRDMDADTAARIAQGIRGGSIDLLAIHIAEGLPSDAESAQELDMLEARGLLTAHTALVHSVGLSPSQLARVHRVGASIVWSPRSNFELYGATANVAAAFREGVTISLAPDWSPSGSDNMFDEIRYASAVSRDQLDGLFSARQLVEMASSVPARVARIDDKVGALAPGMLADLFLVHPEPETNSGGPYNAIAAGKITDIDLVVIGGIPTYGTPEFLRQLGAKTEPLTICGVQRALNVDALPDGPIAQVEARLQAKMRAAGWELAPLAECVP